MKDKLLVCLGRGMQMENEGGKWVLTDDLEMVAENSGHLAVRVLPVDDTSDRCMIGGGELNMLAAIELYRRGPEAYSSAVFAYGERSLYLINAGGPSESEVMSGMFGKHLANFGLPPVQISVWAAERKRQDDKPSNTGTELENAFVLAEYLGIEELDMVTVSVHWPRTMMFSQLLHEQPQFQHLKLNYYRSEQVLVEADPVVYGPRWEILRNSTAFKQNFDREALGIYRRLANFYHDEKPLIT